MKAAEQFLEEFRLKQKDLDYRKSISYDRIVDVMEEYSQYCNDSLIQEIDDQEKLLICFMAHLKNIGVAFDKYTDEDFERMAYVFLMDNEEVDSDNEDWLTLIGNEDLFSKSAKNNCLCKFDNGSVFRFQAKYHPNAILTHFKPDRN